MTRAQEDEIIARVSYATERERVADELADLTASEIRLHMGELSAQEMRAVRAFIGWQVARLREWK